MTRLLGIDFSPLTEPWDKKLQTFGVFIVFTMFFPMIAVGAAIPLILLYTYQWHILFLYALWYLYDRNSPQKGGYENRWLRGWKYNEWFVRYFPSTVHKTAELPADRNYLITCHPHGVISFGLYAAFIREISSNRSRKFPNLHFFACCLRSNFYFMIRREWFLASGFIDCSKESISNVFTSKSAGQAVLLVVGGAQEALYAQTGVHKLKLRTRKGFVKLALRCGASLVPVYTFGENDIYKQLNNAEGSSMQKFQIWSKRLLGKPVALFYGRGLLQACKVEAPVDKILPNRQLALSLRSPRTNFGFLPFRTPVDTVVGAPIDVPQILEPTNEDVDRVHRQYCEALTELFEEHKIHFGVSEDTRLILV